MTVRPRQSASGGPVHALTQRELEVLALVADGLSNREIAQRLFVTQQTVKFHLGNIFRKLGVANRTQAARRADELAAVRWIRLRGRHWDGPRGFDGPSAADGAA